MRDVKQPVVGVFGASGSIGKAICATMASEGWKVLAITRSGASEPATQLAAQCVAWDSEPGDNARDALNAQPLDAAVWAQGSNCTDSIATFDLNQHMALYEANVLFVLRTLHQLLEGDWLAPRSRLCVISSIWQDIARPDKLSYCVTKSALRGLVQSVALDLGSRGMLINAVLPGALDTPMTRANLSAPQIDRLAGMTPVGHLPALDNVCAAVQFLCSPGNTSVTGQFIAVDGGFSYAKVF